MSLNEVRFAPGSSKWRGKRVVIIATALVFAGLVGLGALTPGYAIIAFAILVTVVAFNLMGDGLRDLLDPRLRGRI